MTTKQDDEAQPQDLAERLRIASDAARLASTLVGELVSMADQPADIECERVREILLRLVVLTRLGSMANHPDVTLDQLKQWAVDD
ncbi:hypothetical protein [Variovorax sp. GT1P44]|uniref:hypothetical protein n=1 Tax=Variovorax sp. GT1P44 TaxID=3443742 RepID=UPI003F479CEA